MEIQAICELYKVGIMVWELSGAGELVTSINNTGLAAAKGLESIYLARLWGNHWDSVVYNNRKFPLRRPKEFHLKSWISDVRASSNEPSSVCSSERVPVLSSKVKDHGATTGKPSLEITGSKVETLQNETAKTNSGTSKDSMGVRDER